MNRKLTELVMEDKDLLEYITQEGRRAIFIDYVMSNPPHHGRKHQKVAYLYELGKEFKISSIRNLLIDVLGVKRDALNGMINYARKKRVITELSRPQNSHGLGYLQSNYQSTPTNR